MNICLKRFVRRLRGVDLDGRRSRTVLHVGHERPPFPQPVPCTTFKQHGWMIRLLQPCDPQIRNLDGEGRSPDDDVQNSGAGEELQPLRSLQWDEHRAGKRADGRMTAVRTRAVGSADGCGNEGCRAAHLDPQSPTFEEGERSAGTGSRGEPQAIVRAVHAVASGQCDPRELTADLHGVPAGGHQHAKRSRKRKLHAVPIISALLAATSCATSFHSPSSDSELAALAQPGPYRVAEWKSGEYVLLERVPHYWRGDQYPAIRRLLFKFIANTNTRVNQLKSGEVHVVALVPWDKYREIADLPSLTIHKTRGNAYEHVTLNEQHFPPFADVRVRRALTYALDRELLTRTILDGLAPVAHGPIQPVSWAYTEHITRYGFEPARARALLDEAGWKMGANGIRQRDGRPLAFTLITQAGFAIRENMAQAIERQLRDVGVDVTVQLHDGTAISAIWFEGRFDAMLHWWQMPSDPELTTFFAADRTPPAGRNINYYKDDELTRLLYASDRTVDRAERTRLLHRAQQIVAEAAPEIPLYSITRLDAIPSTLQHFKGNPTNTGIFWNVHEWQVRVEGIR